MYLCAAKINCVKVKRLRSEWTLLDVDGDNYRRVQTISFHFVIALVSDLTR